MASASMTYWTNDESKLLDALVTDGLSWEEIGSYFGRPGGDCEAHSKRTRVENSKPDTIYDITESEAEESDEDSGTQSEEDVSEDDENSCLASRAQRWSDAEKATLVRLKSTTMTWKEVAQKMNRTVAACRQALYAQKHSAANTPPRNCEANHVSSIKRRSKVVKLPQNKQSANGDLAPETHGEPLVYWARVAGCPRKLVWTSSGDAELLRLKHAGVNEKKIADKFQISATSCWKRFQFLSKSQAGGQPSVDVRASLTREKATSLLLSTSVKETSLPTLSAEPTQQQTLLLPSEELCQASFSPSAHSSMLSSSLSNTLALNQTSSSMPILPAEASQKQAVLVSPELFEASSSLSVHSVPISSVLPIPSLPSIMAHHASLEGRAIASTLTNAAQAESSSKRATNRQLAEWLATVRDLEDLDEVAEFASTPTVVACATPSERTLVTNDSFDAVEKDGEYWKARVSAVNEKLKRLHSCLGTHIAAHLPDGSTGKLGHERGGHLSKILLETFPNLSQIGHMDKEPDLLNTEKQVGGVTLVDVEGMTLQLLPEMPEDTLQIVLVQDIHILKKHKGLTV